MSDPRDTEFYSKALGCLMGGLIGDAMGTPTEGKHYREIESEFGWVDDFSCDGTDDTIMRDLLVEALVRSDGYATLDDWAAVWLDRWDAIFGVKINKLFISVLHTAQKLRRHCVPRMVALGNMPSSSSAMCIARVGIINACNPRRAAEQAYGLAGLIHTHDVGFCQDGAVAIGAAVAAAFEPEATVESICAAARVHLLPHSGQEMRQRIDAALVLAHQLADYGAFRREVYEQSDHFFCRITCDSRETVPLTFALLALAEGDPERAVIYAANLGRDTDTIGAMVGGITGALAGVAGFRSSWLERVRRLAVRDQSALALELVEVAMRKHARERQSLATFARIAGAEDLSAGRGG